LRALLIALDRWVKDGVEPPPSQYPMLGTHTAVLLRDVRFPAIPGVAFPARIRTAYRLDYGPQFREKGIAAIEPPRVGRAFATLLPQVDRDGNDIAGVRMPCIETPLATSRRLESA
jgi:hypothetical protein